jgi:hypothetical protein
MFTAETSPGRPRGQRGNRCQRRASARETPRRSVPEEARIHSGGLGPADDIHVTAALLGPLTIPCSEPTMRRTCRRQRAAEGARTDVQGRPADQPDRRKIRLRIHSRADAGAAHTTQLPEEPTPAAQAARPLSPTERDWILRSAISSQALEGVLIPYQEASDILDEVLGEPLPDLD